MTEPTVTVTEQQAAAAAAAFEGFALQYAANPHGYGDVWAERADTMRRVERYLREEPAAVSVNFDEDSAVYWPLRVYLDSPAGEELRAVELKELRGDVAV